VDTLVAGVAPYINYNSFFFFVSIFIYCRDMIINLNLVPYLIIGLFCCLIIRATSGRNPLAIYLLFLFFWPIVLPLILFLWLLDLLFKIEL